MKNPATESIETRSDYLTKTEEMAMDDMQQNSLKCEQDIKYLTFALGNEEYGLGIIKIREIIGIMNITHVPQMPAYVKGVVNLRGRIIPILDLRALFGMPEVDYSERTCIIVVETTESKKSASQFGLVVDAVSEVANIKEKDIEEPPTCWDTGKTMFISGIAKVGRQVKMLLNIDHIVNESSAISRLAVAGH